MHATPPPAPPSYVIGGNGGNAAAHAISKECEAQGVVCNVVGVPKSIDNDIQLVRWACRACCACCGRLHAAPMRRCLPPGLGRRLLALSAHAPASCRQPRLQ